MYNQKLRNVEIFQDLDDNELRELAEHFFEISVPAEHLLFRTNQPAKSLFVLKEGGVVLRRDLGRTSTEVSRLRPGDHFGEFGISLERERSLTALTTVPSLILEITKDDLMAFIGDHPMVALRLHMAASRRLRPIDLSEHLNKRQCPRTKIRKRVLLTLADSSAWVSQLDDISVTGLRLTSLPPDWREVGQRVSFHLGIGAAILQLSAQIIWMGDDAAGLEFTQRSGGHDMKIQWAKRQLLALEEPADPEEDFWAQRACA
jgi:CRP-like cAMP-binding protein